MCGIAYKHNLLGLPVNNDILQQFDAQRSRGTEGFGYFDGQEMNMFKAANENKILKALVKYNSSLILFHHRRPTSTINVKRAAHPFSTKDYFGDTQYILVHNGHVSNSYSLQHKHAEAGIEYQSLLQDGTFNDSEALLWDFALTMEGKQDSLKAYGGIAFVCIKTVKGRLDKLYFGRNTSPLNLNRLKDSVELSSEGKGEPITPGWLYTYNYKLNRLTSKFFRIPSYAATSSGSTWQDYQRTQDNVSKSWGVNNWDRDIIDYDQDGYPIYEQETLRLPPITGRSYEFPIEDIETEVFQYLMRANGNYDTAYQYAEWDYEQMMDETFQLEYIPRSVQLQEEVLEYMFNHPEYKDDKSVSSLWEATCQTQN